MLDLPVEALKQFARGIRNGWLWTRFLIDRKLFKNEAVRFRCNICGKQTIAPLRLVTQREAPSCSSCFSNRRFRAIIAALSRELFDEIVPLSEMVHCNPIVGVGLSDANIYARPLSKKFSYENTYYHKKPRLDITSPGKEMFETADFVIASDIFEHICPPIDQAFDKLFKIMKKGGFCVFSVPYNDEGETVEHYPELFEFEIVRRGGKKVLINTTRDGKKQAFKNLKFHGGHGATLEMRIFSKSSLIEGFKKAGFADIRVHDDCIPEIGVLFDDNEPSQIITFRKP